MSIGNWLSARGARRNSKPVLESRSGKIGPSGIVRVCAAVIAGLVMTDTALANRGGSGHLLAITDKGFVNAWGYNSSGELGDGTTTNNSMTWVKTADGQGLNNVVAIGGGSTASYAVTASGTLYSWGSNSNYELGKGTLDPFPNNTLFATPVDLSYLSPPSPIVAVDGGFMNAIALRADGRVLQWGALKDRLVKRPELVPGVFDAKSIAQGSGGAFFAVRTDGTVAGWGNNLAGLLGAGDPVTAWVTDPTTVRTLSGQPLQNVKMVSAGENWALALTADGSVWYWGTTNEVPCGVPNCEAFAQKSNISNAIWIETGALHNIAILADGSILTWGQSSDYKLGPDAPCCSAAYNREITNPYTIPRSTLPDSRNWGRAVAAYSARDSWYVVYADGSISRFGSNTNLAAQPIMYKEVALLDARGYLTGKETLARGYYNSHSLSNPRGFNGYTETNGVGYNNANDIYNSGANTNLYTTKSYCPDATTDLCGTSDGLAGTPTGLAASTWTALVMSDGTIMTKGNAGYNGINLGDGSTTSRGTFRKVPGLPLMTDVDAGWEFTIALAADGTVWSWGWNGNGNLGRGMNPAQTNSTPTPGKVVDSSGEYRHPSRWQNPLK